MKFFPINSWINRALVFCGALTFAATAKADVYWNWSFGTESGIFRTNGTEANLGGASFTILDFYVLKTGQSVEPGSISGGQYFVGQPNIGFTWNGSKATEFFRASGTYTNGTVIFLMSDTNVLYGFHPNAGAKAGNSRLRTADSTPIIYTEGSLSLAPILDPVLAQPDIRIGKRSNPVTHTGNDVYTRTGAGQKMKLRIPARGRTRFYFSAESDADVPDAIHVTAKNSPAPFRTRYFVYDGVNFVNQTATLATTGYTVPELAEEPVLFRVDTKSKSRDRSRLAFRFTARSNTKPAIRDVAKAIVIAK